MSKYELISLCSGGFGSAYCLGEGLDGPNVLVPAGAFDPLSFCYLFGMSLGVLLHLCDDIYAVSLEIRNVFLGE
jgi:hypothetical protein